MAAEDGKTDEYRLDSNPCGLCLIINNETFKVTEKKRDGSQKDVDSLSGLFKDLGFVVEIRTDQTASEIKELMNKYRENRYHADCFVCCVMSHGNETGVLGHDNQMCPLEDIISPFDGDKCPSLIGKPKVFFIQACRGSKMQKAVDVPGDFSGGFPSGPKFDTVLYTIAQSSDFLVAMSTVEGYFSIRNKCSGSWFIQSLCHHLNHGSEQGLDILKILTKVNDNVSRMESESKKGKGKMTPVFYSTLRKTLIFQKKKSSSSQMQRSTSSRSQK